MLQILKDKDKELILLNERSEWSITDTLRGAYKINLI